MEFRVLGPVGIAAGGRTIPLVSERQRTLLAALLSQAGQPVSSETLADAVWDGRPPVSAATSLRSHIARLRKVLGAAGGGQALMTDLGGYHIDLGGHRLDAQRFEELLADQPDDPRSALDTLEEALGLWYGAAYAPFTDRSFARAEAARLTGLREAALADRTDLLLELGRHAEAVGELEARISSQPLDERAHTQLMLALYRAGRQGDALAVYRSLQARLVEELGINASGSVEALYRAILGQEPTLDLPRVTSPGLRGSSAASIPGRTAAQAPELFGRMTALEDLGDRLASHRLVTLTGPGGVGKTALAAAAAATRRLDGLPLALELAAAQLPGLGPRDIAARLDQRFRLLTGGALDQGERHRTLTAVVDWSYDLLPAAEAQLFQRLSVFMGPFALEDAEAVCAGDGLETADIAAAIGNLAERSMISAVAVGGRVQYRWLETLRAYATERLVASGSADRWRLAHAHHVVQAAETVALQLRGPQEAVAVTRIDAIADDLRVAHRALTQRGAVEPALRLAAALHEYVTHRMRTEMVEWATSAADLADAAGHPAWPAARITVAWGALWRRHASLAEHLANEAITRTSDRRTVQRALHVLADTALLQGRTTACVEVSERAEALAREADEPYDLAAAGLRRVLGHLYAGEIATAEASIRGVRAAAARADNPTMRAWTLLAHGEVLAARDDRRAVETFDEAIGVAASVDGQLIIGIARVAKAALLERTGSDEETVAAFCDALAHWRSLGNPPSQLTALRNLVTLLTRIGEDREAARLYGTLTAQDTVSRPFGAESHRLAQAWQHIVDHLGPQALELAADGATRHVDDAVDAALAILTSLGSADHVVAKNRISSSATP